MSLLGDHHTPLPFLHPLSRLSGTQDQADVSDFRAFRDLSSYRWYVHAIYAWRAAWCMGLDTFWGGLVSCHSGGGAEGIRQEPASCALNRPLSTDGVACRGCD